MNASQCRSEQHEGWSWAKSLRYHTEFEDLDFQPIHQELDSYHTQLAGLLNLTGRNLCTAQIHLIVEPVAGGPLQLITSPGRINLQNKIPLTKHVFISGSEKPEGKGTGFKLITEVERENEPKKWTPKLTDKLSVCQVAVEVEEKEKKSQAIADYIIIHPCKPYFTDIGANIERLLQRYSGIPVNKLSVKAALAREWVAIHQMPPVQASRMNRFLATIRRTSVMRQTDVTQQENAWFDKANQQWPSHEKARQETENVFFTNTGDSEQKLFYYLDLITAYSEYFSQLELIMDRMEKWYESSGIHKARLVRCIMQYCDASPSIRMIAADASHDAPQGETWSTIRENVNTILLFCADEMKRIGLQNYRLNRLKEYAQKLVDMGDVLAEGREDEVLGLRKELLAQYKASLSESDFIQSLRAHRMKQNNPDLHAQKIYEYLMPKNLFKALKSEREFKTDPVVVGFNALITEILQNNPDVRIHSVALNIHSTNDICFGCAPDLARESHRGDSFAAYFIKSAQEQNKFYGRGDKEIFFRCIYSCSTIREAARCQRCTFNQRPQVDPSWEKPSQIAFYQHYLHSKVDKKSGIRSPHDVIQQEKTILSASSTSTLRSADSDEEGDVRRTSKNADKEPLMREQKEKSQKKKKASRERLPGNDDD